MQTSDGFIHVIRGGKMAFVYTDRKTYARERLINRAIRECEFLILVYPFLSYFVLNQRKDDPQFFVDWKMTISSTRMTLKKFLFSQKYREKYGVHFGRNVFSLFVIAAFTSLERSNFTLVKKYCPSFLFARYTISNSYAPISTRIFWQT